MPCVFILAIVALLGFAPLGGFSVAARQSSPSPSVESTEGEWAWDGVRVEGPLGGTARASARRSLHEFLGSQEGSQPGQGRSLSAQLETFRVPFENRDILQSAFIPEVIGAEFMVVIVETGEFILDVKGPGSYLVDPVADTDDRLDIEIMIGDISLDRQRIYYTPSGHVILNETGHICDSLCTVLPGFAVKLTKGDRVIAPAGAICVWCLLNGDDAAAPVQEGALTVFPLLRSDHEFSWVLEARRSARLAAGAPESAPATPAASVAAFGMMGWAFFSPGPGCHRGQG